MDETNSILTPVTKKRLIIQGFSCYTDKELNDYKHGIRFSYYLCDLLLILGLLLANFYILATIMIISFFGALLQHHPFDYLYNYVIRHIINKPPIPIRTNQTRFACGIAAVWICLIIFLFYIHLNLWAYIAGGIIVFVATLVATTDICIPSMIYNFLFKKEQQNN